MFNPQDVVYNGIPLIVLVFGLVEFFKHLFTLEGKQITLLSMLMGMIVMISFQLVDLLPETYNTVYNVVIGSVVFGLTASGYYKFVTDRITKDGNRSG